LLVVYFLIFGNDNVRRGKKEERKNGKNRKRNRKK
jgi:hypothetical protein